jgi:hypothetical protein
MTTLKDAQKDGKLDQFIAERKTQPKGDLTKLEAAIDSAAKTPTKAPKPSRPGKRVG